MDENLLHVDVDYSIHCHGFLYSITSQTLVFIANLVNAYTVGDRQNAKKQVINMFY